MDDRRPAARDTLQQRFQALATQFRENHAAWQEAVRGHDRPRQAALIGREGAILTEVREVLTAFRATIAQRHQEARRAPVRHSDVPVTRAVRRTAT
jgi:hypothetical protein